MNKKNNSYKITFILYFTLFTLILGLGILSNQTLSKAAKKPYLASSSATIFVNGTYTISVKNKIAHSTCFFTSNKTKVAKVNSKGTVTGLKKGTAQIKVRYKLKGKFHTIGSFNVTVKKATINSKYYKEDYYMTTGQTLPASTYLNTVNTAATYNITSSDENIATGSSDGTITALKAGKVSLSINEVYNKKSRKIGSVILTITGSSLKTKDVKMPYNSTLNITQFIEDFNKTSIYTLNSSDTSLVSVKDNILLSASSGIDNKTCTITVCETTLDDNATHTVGTFTVSLTNSAYIADENQTVYLGIGDRLEIGAEDNICISNPNKYATYTIVPSEEPTETSILSDNLVAQKYGPTEVSIKETINGKSTILLNKIKVIVEKASIRDELLTDGFTTSVGGDTYGKYPVKCRNHNYIYSYEVENKNVCDANPAGNHPDEDYLIINPKIVQNTRITVYEKTSVSSTKRTKVGSFAVIVTADNSVPLNPYNINASDIIKALSVTCNGKTYSADVSNDDMTCSFTDKNNNGTIDYGTNLENITANDFNITFKKAKYTIQSADSTNGSDWTFIIGLGTNDNDSSDNEESTAELTVSLRTSDFKTSSILKNIMVQLGPTTKTITQTTPFYYNNSMMQFDDDNKNFEIQFTPAQYISAGATEYKNGADNPVYLRDLKNVRCFVTPNTFNSKTNPTGNAAVTRITDPISDDNEEWTFTITFDDGTTEDCTVRLEVSYN